MVIDGRHPGCLKSSTVTRRSASSTARCRSLRFEDDTSSLHEPTRSIAVAAALFKSRPQRRMIRQARTVDFSSSISRAMAACVRATSIRRSCESIPDSSMMIGLFSVNEGIPGKVNRDGKCYIALSLSCDGVHWSRFTPLMKTEGERGRTFDQPVSGSAARRARAVFRSA